MKKHKKVIIYKLGRFQEDFEYIFSNIKIKSYITDKKIKEFNNKKCIYINDLKDNVKNINSLIVICDRKNNKIKDKFNDIGFKENKDYIFLEDFGKILDETFSIKERILNPFYKLILHRDFKGDSISNSEMFKKMIYTDATHNLNCMEPFRYAQIQPNGFLYSCCPGIIEEHMGNIFLSSPKKVWNSTRAKIIRLSIINKTYAFCNLKHCRLSDNKDMKRVNDLKASKFPKYTVLSFDESCNLKCKSCRNCAINYNKSKRATYIHNNISKKLFKAGWLNKCKQLVIATQGEVFFSNIYQKILFSNKIKNLNTLIIHTNGTLLSPKKLEKLCTHCQTNNINHININVSVDSINEKNYESIRPGGNLKILKRNLEAISKARSEGKLYYVNIVVVLQRANYKELPEIAKYMIKLNFDRLDVQTIINLGTYSDEEFKNIYMLDEKGNPKPELEEVLKDPIFKSSKIDFAGNIFKKETYMD